MDPDSLFSFHVSRSLDCLGKSQEIVKFRVDQYKERESLLPHLDRNSQCLIAGSKGEGLTAPFESDVDILVINDYTICADDPFQFTYLTGFSVFETERRYTSPGYTKLRQTGCIGPWKFYSPLLMKDKNGHFYLSSDLYMEGLSNIMPHDSILIFLNRSGPSIPTLNKMDSCSQDFVIALPCICPQITQSFINRPRYYGWPSNDQLIEISSFESHVVPVGYKGSDTHFLEWRVCYTEAERLLMRSLNNTQTKVYILLKLVAKTYLNSITKDITSYVLKNIMLWMVECSDHESFNEGSLIGKLIQALAFLRRRIITNNLPSYMIPERNLIAEKLLLVQRQQLIYLLTELINKGGGLLMGCERLRDTMIVLYKEPGIAEHYRCKRDTLEKLWLRICNEWLYYAVSAESAASDPRVRFVEVVTSKMTDAGFIKKHESLHWLVVPDTLSLLLKGQSMPAIFRQRILQWLS